MTTPRGGGGRLLVKVGNPSPPPPPPPPRGAPPDLFGYFWKIPFFLVTFIFGSPGTLSPPSWVQNPQFRFVFWDPPTPTPFVFRFGRWWNGWSSHDPFIFLPHVLFLFLFFSCSFSIQPPAGNQQLALSLLQIGVFPFISFFSICLEIKNNRENKRIRSGKIKRLDCSNGHRCGKYPSQNNSYHIPKCVITTPLFFATP